MPSYAKVYASIFTGSLRGHADEILVFVNMLTHTTRDGVCDVHWQTIVDETGLSESRVLKAIGVLSSPDPESRSPANEGRRIAQLDERRRWGWRIVNHDFYRNLTADDRYREKTRIRVKRYRDNQQLTESCNATETLLHGSVYGSVPEGVQGGPKQDQNGSLPEASNVPSTETAAIALSMALGVPEDFVIHTWNKAMSRGGRDAKDVPIRNWVRYLQTEWTYHRARNGKPQSSVSPGLQIRSIEEVIECHQANKESAFYDPKCTDLQRADLRSLREKLKTLRGQIARA